MNTTGVKLNYRFILIASLLTLFNLTSYSQEKYYTFSDLRGLQDSSGSVHLFYRLQFQEGDAADNTHGNSIYHLDLKNNSDTLFLTDYGFNSRVNQGYSISIIDFEFWDNDPDKYIYSAVGCGFDCGPIVQRFDSSVSSNLFGGFGPPFTRLSISGQHDSMLYANYGSLIKSTDGGRNWNWVDSLNNYSFISLNRYDDQILYLQKSRTYHTEVIDSMFILNHGRLSLTRFIAGNYSEFLKMYYDPDSVHVYLILRDQYKFYLSVSDDKGKSGSWTDIPLRNFVNGCFDGMDVYQRVPILQADKSLSGHLYIAYDNNIYSSYDYGKTFKQFKSFNKSIVGFYIPPGSDTIFAEDSYHLFKITNETTDTLKSLPADTSFLSLFPLHIGDKWIYKVSQPHFGVGDKKIPYTDVKTVTGDSLMPNGKKYFVLEDWSGRQFFRIDSLHAKVYQYQSGMEEESVLFDLSAEAGEIYTGIHDPGSPGSEFIVSSMKNYELYDTGLKQKTYNNCSLDTRCYSLVEDIGIDSIFIGNDFMYAKEKLAGAVINGKVYGDTTYTSVDDYTNHPESFKLSQNYPNPFNPSTTIEYHLPQAENVTLKIYDILGNEVETLVNKYQYAGSHKVVFNTQQTTNHKQLSSGIYFYRLKAGNFYSVKKMILMK